MSKAQFLLNQIRLNPAIFLKTLLRLYYTQGETRPLSAEKIKSIVKLDYVRTPKLWVTSGGQPLYSPETYKVRLKYAHQVGRFGL